MPNIYNKNNNNLVQIRIQSLCNMSFKTKTFTFFFSQRSHAILTGKTVYLFK